MARRDTVLRELVGIVKGLAGLAMTGLLAILALGLLYACGSAAEDEGPYIAPYGDYDPPAPVDQGP